MPAENHDHTLTTKTSDETKEMAKYGIIRTPVDYFYYGTYRYTDLKDAIAQAKRQTTTN